ncbi:MAG: protease inhibitor I42 family protein [Candidatus Margulisiibacteriota bacterium]
MKVHLFIICALVIILSAGGVYGMGGKPPDRKVSVGEEFTITLESNPTTGYQWQLARPLDDKIVGLGESKYEMEKQESVETGMVGVGGHEYWTFKAKGKGTTSIELKYVRPWEKDAPPVETAVFRIRVE